MLITCIYSIVDVCHAMQVFLLLHRGITRGQSDLAKAVLNDPHTIHVPPSWATWQTDRQTPRTSVTIVCISCSLIIIYKYFLVFQLNIFSPLTSTASSDVGQELEGILIELLLCSILLLHNFLGSIQVHQIGFCHFMLCLEAFAFCLFIVTWWSHPNGIEAWSWRPTDFLQCLVMLVGLSDIEMT